MSIASEISRLQSSKADVKTQVNIDKDLINSGTAFIGSETLDDYDDKIEEMQEAYKKFIPIQTGTGTTNVFIDNTSDDKVMTDIALYGNSEQFTTTGINLLPNEIQSQTINNVTIVRNSDGSLLINSTNNTGTRINFTDSLTLAAGTYTVSTKELSNATGYLSFLENGTEFFSMPFKTVKTKQLVLEAETTFQPTLYLSNGQSYSNFTLTPMIELGTTAHNYEPYTRAEWHHLRQVFLKRLMLLLVIAM